ncbi:MAG: electron transport complex subunit RsxD [Gammaproteobacteria bacterium]|nr:electron transport complex subunit RsxD [Gammaproteobacteria bacterium]MCP5426200.1 electron transport complex subunit RsxD [Gammaproteobacteria bacterium]
MRFSTASSPHWFVGPSVSQLMRQVLYAMLPGLATLVWFFGWGVLLHVAIASGAALASEAVVLALRGKPLRLFLGDGSALVTAWLLAAALPAFSPWWITTLGVAFAIVIAKHLYGGLGYNPFNPAMVGYVVLLISFPLEMTTWPPVNPGVDFASSVQIIFSGHPAEHLADALSGATPLDAVKTQLGLGLGITEIINGPAFGLIGGQGWEWAAMAFLAGGLWLVMKRVAAWQIPAGMLGSLALLSGIFYALDPQAHASPWFHLLSFSSIYGAFFIATDPVTASTTPRGRLLFGAGVGALTYLIRCFGGYPDGVAFAVLLMNIAAPTIDYYTQPRVFGARRD